MPLYIAGQRGPGKAGEVVGAWRSRGRLLSGRFRLSC